jgi:hypothetical protein
LDNNHGNVGERNYLEAVSWEGQLDANISSNQKTPVPAAGNNPYKTPSLRIEPVFEASALACGLLTSAQPGCHFRTKAS